jgi:hypothetical protein
LCYNRALRALSEGEANPLPNVRVLGLWPDRITRRIAFLLAADEDDEAGAPAAAAAVADEDDDGGARASAGAAGYDDDD